MFETVGVFVFLNVESTHFRLRHYFIKLTFSYERKITCNQYNRLTVGELQTPL